MAGRVGIASRGIIYLILTYLAFDIARYGSAPTQTSSTGALQELATRSGGKLVLVVLAVGLACYAGWRIFNAAKGVSGAIKRLSSLVVGIIYGGLCVRAVALVTGHPTSGGSSSNPEPWIARILRWPSGTVAIQVVGSILIGAGVGLGVWGLCRRYDKDLALERLSHRWRTVVRVLGGLGDAARGFLVILVGIYFIEAAVTSNPALAKSIDQALRALVHHTFGTLAIALIAFGLLAFGLFSFFDARLKRL
jgi:uncharacterized membrane protein YidH (DUF202 family)